MDSLPDLAPLFYLAVFGALCAVVLFSLGGVWLGSHIFMALSAYFGG